MNDDSDDDKGHESDHHKEHDHGGGGRSGGSGGKGDEGSHGGGHIGYHSIGGHGTHGHGGPVGHGVFEIGTTHAPSSPGATTLQPIMQSSPQVATQSQEHFIGHAPSIPEIAARTRMGQTDVWAPSYQTTQDWSLRPAAIYDDHYEHPYDDQHWDYGHMYHPEYGY